MSCQFTPVQEKFELDHGRRVLKHLWEVQQHRVCLAEDFSPLLPTSPLRLPYAQHKRGHSVPGDTHGRSQLPRPGQAGRELSVSLPIRAPSCSDARRDQHEGTRNSLAVLPEQLPAPSSSRQPAPLPGS